VVAMGQKEPLGLLQNALSSSRLVWCGQSCPPLRQTGNVKAACLAMLDKQAA
jgi:hypothetical protein